MKIRVATLIWKDGYGGAERSVRDLAAALDRERFDMRFFYLAGQRGQFANEIADMGYTVENLYWSNGFSLAGRWRLLQALRHFNPMIIHDHIIPPFTRPLVKLVCRRPVIHTEHGGAMTYNYITNRRGWRRLVNRFDFLFCNRILANSCATYQAVRQIYQVPESKIQVVYLGIDLQNFTSVNNLVTDRDRHRVGFVGRIVNNHKGTDYLPQIARILLEKGHHNIDFVVVGDGPDRSSVELLCKQMNVSHIFTFLGFRRDIPALVRTFNVLLMPSRFEPFGLAALEALAMGVKVVGFDVGGLREAVGECASACLVPPDDINEMANAVISMLKQSQSPPQNSRKYVEAHFSNQRMASDLQQVYSDYA